MKVRLYVERLVLDGLDVSAASRPRLRAAIEAELGRRIAAGGLSRELARGIAVPSIRAPQMTVPSGAKPAELGSAIVGAVYDGLGGKP
jgi:hypothetical protein